MNSSCRGEPKLSPSSNHSQRSSLQCKTSRMCPLSPHLSLEPHSYAHPVTARWIWGGLAQTPVWVVWPAVPATSHTDQETPPLDWAKSRSKVLHPFPSHPLARPSSFLYLSICIMRIIGTRFVHNVILPPPPPPDQLKFTHSAHSCLSILSFSVYIFITPILFVYMCDKGPVCFWACYIQANLAPVVMGIISFMLCCTVLWHVSIRFAMEITHMNQ